jgi:cytochrome c oxidase cbb3-type subunit 3
MSDESRRDPIPPPEDDRLLDHRYDGIQEYDNPLPRWWTTIFWATILYAGVYLLNVPGIGNGQGRIAQYERHMALAAALDSARRAQAAPAGDLTDAALLAMSRDAARIAPGRERFGSTCAACHRADGGGGIGPNLTDEFWIHGARPTEILTVVRDGVPDKGMPTWSQTLTPDEIAAVAAYVLTLRDTHPPDPKEPQGEKIESNGEKAEAGS